MTLRKTLIASAVAIMTLTPGAASASLEQEMNKLFGGISNITDPSSVDGARRGVVQGGGVYTRVPLARVVPFNIQMPRVDAGCGGLDAFGGSFSFINKDQYIQLLRSIAGNATGYAFKLALNTLSPMIGGITEDLQKSIQALNAAALDSCNIAQNLVNLIPGSPQSADIEATKTREGGAVVSALAGGLTQGIDAVGSFIGKLNDPWSETTPEGQNVAYRTGQFGNATWRMLNEGPGAMRAWFQFGGTELMNAILSYAGTIIITPPAPNSQSPNGTVGRIQPSILSVRQLYYGNLDPSGNVTGQTIRLYQCPNYDDTDPANNRAAVCMSLPGPDGVVPPLSINPDATLQGLHSRVTRVLLGDGVNGGLSQKFAGGLMGSLTPEEESFIALAPDFAAKLQQIGILNPGAAPTFARQIATPLAIQLTESLTSDLITALIQASADNSHIAGAGDVAAKMAELRAEAAAFFQEVKQDVHTRNTLLAIADNYIAGAQPMMLSPGPVAGPSQSTGPAASTP